MPTAARISATPANAPLRNDVNRGSAAVSSNQSRSQRTCVTGCARSAACAAWRSRRAAAVESARCADDQRQRAQGLLRHGEIGRRSWIEIEATATRTLSGAAADVAHHADHGCRARTVPLDRLPNRIGAWPQRAGDTLRDNGHARRFERVLRAKSAAGQDRNTERPEVGRAHDVLDRAKRPIRRRRS
jgi:hypothetical protein